MKYLSIEEVVAIHFEVIKKFGGSQGVKDFGLLHSAVERPKASFGSEDLYSSIYDKAAALLHSLILNHPFVDGNKRTAYISTARFFFVNGLMVRKNKKATLGFILKIEREKLTIKAIASWLEENTEKART